MNWIKKSKEQRTYYKAYNAVWKNFVYKKTKGYKTGAIKKKAQNSCKNLAPVYASKKIYKQANRQHKGYDYCKINEYAKKILQ